MKSQINYNGWKQKRDDETQDGIQVSTLDTDDNNRGIKEELFERVSVDRKLSLLVDLASLLGVVKILIFVKLRLFQ